MKNIKSTNHQHRLSQVAAITALMLGALIGGTAFAGVASTKHNLGSSGIGVNKFDGTADLCVFCHTPHGSDTDAVVPLWNRKMAAPATYTTYNSLGTSSLDGATAPVGSVSLACLSCHDGSQAMNTMINQPGSGLYNAGGAAMAGSWGTSANQTAGALSLGLITNLEKDLQNDHPIGIQYAGGNPTGTYPATGQHTVFNDPDFHPAESQVLNTKQVWWVETGTAGRQKTDMHLYSRSEPGINTGAVQPFVECASCHDPHSDVNPTFLRYSNAGSAVCLACHIK